VRRHSKPHKNRLLAELSPADLDLLQSEFEPLELKVRTSIEEPNKPIKHIYFFEEGIASVVNRGDDGREVEVGIIGCEGISGAAVALGNDRSPHHTYMQVAGSAVRISADDFRISLEASATLRKFMLQYVQNFMLQTAGTATANGRANVEQRLARWLLMAHDRVKRDELSLTHEFLATMLAVRRPGVTTALNEVKRRGLIQLERRSVIIVDRKGLERLAGRYYGGPESEWRRIMAGRS
jgi:CRP-like cAMP-binding protein